MSIHKWYDEILAADAEAVHSAEDAQDRYEDAVRDREIAQADAYTDAMVNGEQLTMMG